jgi:Uncharacterized conserved protein
LKKVIVLPYDEKWKAEFGRIREELVAVLGALAIAIEHVGSTAVEGLCAKPIIDIDVVIGDYNSFEAVKDKLSSIGYVHEGDLGVKERHAFKYSGKPHLMKHHLYVCPVYSEELKRHIVFRDYLRVNPQDRDWYGEVKTLAAVRFPEDVDSYMVAKSPCVVEIIKRALL